jgi:O-antigen ligase
MAEAVLLPQIKRISMPSLRVLLLYVFVVSIPFYGFSLYNIGERGFLRPDWLIGGLLVITFLFWTLIHRERIKINRTGKAILLLNIAAIVSTVSYFNKKEIYLLEFLTLWLQLIFMTLLFFSITNMGLTTRNLKTVFKLWIFIAFIVSIYGIYQVFARNLDLPLAYLPLSNPSIAEGGMKGDTFGGYVRPSSILREPTFLSAYLISPILLLGITFFHQRDRIFFFASRLLNGTIFFTMIIALILSFALAGYATLIIIAFFTFLDRRMRRFLLKGIIGLVLIVGLLTFGLQLAGINFKSVNERISGLVSKVEYRGLESISGTSIGGRLAEVITGLKVWYQNPLLGIGLNASQIESQEHMWPKWYTYGVETKRYHNVWIHALAEMGLFGFIALVLVWGSAIKSLWREVQKTKGVYKILLLSMYYVLLADVIGSTFNLSFVHPQRWFDLAIASLLIYIVRKKEDINENLGSFTDLPSAT